MRRVSGPIPSLNTPIVTIGWNYSKYPMWTKVHSLLVSLIKLFSPVSDSDIKVINCLSGCSTTVSPWNYGSVYTAIQYTYTVLSNFRRKICTKRELAFLQSREVCRQFHILSCNYKQTLEFALNCLSYIAGCGLPGVWILTTTNTKCCAGSLHIQLLYSSFNKQTDLLLTYY